MVVLMFWGPAAECSFRKSDNSSEGKRKRGGGWGKWGFSLPFRVESEFYFDIFQHCALLASKCAHYYPPSLSVACSSSSSFPPSTCSPPSSPFSLSILLLSPSLLTPFLSSLPNVFLSGLKWNRKCWFYSFLIRVVSCALILNASSAARAGVLGFFLVFLRVLNGIISRCVMHKWISVSHLWSYIIPWKGKCVFDMVIGENLNSYGAYPAYNWGQWYGYNWCLFMSFLIIFFLAMPSVFNLYSLLLFAFYLVVMIAVAGGWRLYVSGCPFVFHVHLNSK